eukprot:9416898-Alexandrium_andersonii.AAC.1
MIGFGTCPVLWGSSKQIAGTWSQASCSQTSGRAVVNPEQTKTVVLLDTLRGYLSDRRVGRWRQRDLGKGGEGRKGPSMSRQ